MGYDEYYGGVLQTSVTVGFIFTILTVGSLWWLSRSLDWTLSLGDRFQEHLAHSKAKTSIWTSTHERSHLNPPASGGVYSLVSSSSVGPSWLSVTEDAMLARRSKKLKTQNNFSLCNFFVEDRHHTISSRPAIAFKSNCVNWNSQNKGCFKSSKNSPTSLLQLPHLRRWCLQGAAEVSQTDDWRPCVGDENIGTCDHGR